MRIKSVKILFALLIISFMNTNILAQSQDELIRKAKAMGFTDAMINEQITKQNAQKKSTTSVKENTESQADRTRKTTTLTETDKQKNDSLKTVKNPVFGADIFSSYDLSFAPNSNIATPRDYRLAAGDEIIIDVWGASEANYRETISPDGTIYIENAGLISLTGLSVEEAEKRLKIKLSEIYSGLTENSEAVDIKVSLGQIRSIKVNMSGEVEVPGTYTLSSLSTLFNALYAANGVNDIGTLREIKLYRNNKLITTLDVYDYLLNGNEQANVRLEDNDMIIVSPYQNRVIVTGEVKRPKIYELKKEETLQDLINYTGGFAGGAFTNKLAIDRKNGKMSQLYTVDNKDFGTFIMLDGDSVNAPKTIDRYENKVTISGAVWRPGDYELTEKTKTIKQLIKVADGLRGDEFKNRALITRVLPDSTLQTISFDVAKLMSGNEEDIILETDDKIFIPTVNETKEVFHISIDGEVNKPIAELLFTENMTVEDAILVAGGFKEAASEAKIIVSRVIKDPKSTSFSKNITQDFEFQISKDLKLGESATNFVLQPFDHILVRRSPAYHEKQKVTIKGEVLFPGDYVLTQKGERLSDLIDRAGGLSPQVYIKGANLRRQKSEDEIIKEKALKSVMQNAEMTEKEYNVGIDLAAAYKNRGGLQDIVLKDGDVLYIPELISTVKINGAVLYPNSTVYKKGADLKDYLDQAGGYAQNARKRPYVVYMNGQVGATKRTFFVKRYPKIEPGCEIVVPLKQEMPRMRMGAAEVIAMISSLASTSAIIYSITK